MSSAIHARRVKKSRKFVDFFWTYAGIISYLRDAYARDFPKRVRKKINILDRRVKRNRLRSIRRFCLYSPV